MPDSGGDWGSPSRPPPTIGKIGPYTVFITPPEETQTPTSPQLDHHHHTLRPPPVQPPPSQLDKLQHSSDSISNSNSNSKLAFFWSAVSKVQDAHSSLDQHVARWFGLNQSKYQWALDDYYESKGMVDNVKAREMSSKAQNV